MKITKKYWFIAKKPNNLQRFKTDMIDIVQDDNLDNIFKEMEKLKKYGYYILEKNFIG